MRLARARSRARRGEKKPLEPDVVNHVVLEEHVVNPAAFSAAARTRAVFVGIAPVVHDHAERPRALDVDVHLPREREPAKRRSRAEVPERGESANRRRRRVATSVAKTMFRVKRGDRRVMRHLLQHGSDGCAVVETNRVPGGLPEHGVERFLKKRGGLAVRQNRRNNGEHPFLFIVETFGARSSAYHLRGRYLRGLPYLGLKRELSGTDTVATVKVSERPVKAGEQPRRSRRPPREPVVARFENAGVLVESREILWFENEILPVAVFFVLVVRRTDEL